MYEVHGWFALSDSTYESDITKVREEARHVERQISKLETSISFALKLHVLNGQIFLVITGFPNRRRSDGVVLDDVLEVIRERLPGSYGLLYERDDEMDYPPGGNAFRVTVPTRGHLTRRADPFLSPCNPTIED